VIKARLSLYKCIWVESRKNPTFLTQQAPVPGQTAVRTQTGSAVTVTAPACTARIHAVLTITGLRARWKMFIYNISLYIILIIYYNIYVYGILYKWRLWKLKNYVKCRSSYTSTNTHLQIYFNSKSAYNANNILSSCEKRRMHLPVLQVMPVHPALQPVSQTPVTGWHVPKMQLPHRWSQSWPYQPWLHSTK